MSRFQLGKRAQQAQYAHALRSVPLFRGLPASDLIAIWQKLQEVSMPAGAVVCRRGEAGDQFYVIQSGTLEVRLGLGPSGFPVTRLGPGNFVGEMSLLTGAPRSADVVVAEDAVLWVLGYSDFQNLLDSRVSLVRAFNRALCDRVAQLTAQLEERTSGAGKGPAGMRFGPYRAIEQIGAGGMAAVYSAIHCVDETAAAIKVLPAAWGAAPDLRERLAREAAALQRIGHRHVITVLDVGEVEAHLGGGCYLALEWIPHALDRVLRAQYPEPLPVPAALQMARGVAEGLAAIHAAGFVHRDVKPSNILLRADGSPVLTDLGLATAMAESAQVRRLTHPDMVIGTADYLSPEQVAGKAVDARADLYSLGVVLYEMLAGYVPFAGLAPLEALRAHLHEPPPPLPEALPPAVRAIVERAMAKNPDERFASGTEMAVALERAAGQGEPAGT